MLEVFEASPAQLHEVVARIATVLAGRHPETVNELDKLVAVLEERNTRETRVSFLRAIQALEVVEPQVFVVVRLWAKEVRHG